MIVCNFVIKAFPSRARRPSPPRILSLEKRWDDFLYLLNLDRRSPYPEISVVQSSSEMAGRYKLCFYLPLRFEACWQALLLFLERAVVLITVDLVVRVVVVAAAERIRVLVLSACPPRSASLLAVPYSASPLLESRFASSFSLPLPVVVTLS